MNDSSIFVYGNVTGPAAATNNCLVLFNGTTGKILKDSGVVLPVGTLVGTSDTQTLTNKKVIFTGSADWSGAAQAEVRGNGLTDSTSSAFMSFHRPGAFAANFGIDNNNVLQWTGWSLSTTIPWSVTSDGVMAVLKTVYFRGGAQVVTATGAATTVNFASGQKVHLILQSNTTVTFNFPGVGNYQILLIQDATGNRTVTWAAGNNPQYVGSATAPAINLSANGMTMVSIYWSNSAAFIQASKVNAA